MNTLSRVLTGDLRPWLNSEPEKYYNEQLHQFNPAQTTFTPHYKIKFERHFSTKTLYYQILIDNSITNYCNNLFQEIKCGSKSLMSDKINKAREALHTQIKRAGNIINSQHLDLSELKQWQDFDTDRQHKETTYVIHYLLSALIKCNMEIQSHFHAMMAPIDIWDIRDFYTMLLRRRAPDEPCIIEISQTTTTSPQGKPVILSEAKDLLSPQTATIFEEKYIDFLQKTQPYLFTDLPKYKALSIRNQIRLVCQITRKDLPYAVAMLDFLDYPKHLATNHAMPKERQYTHIANAIGAKPRAVKGNFLALNPASSEDRTRYTAPDFQTTVRNFYFSLLDNTL